MKELRMCHLLFSRLPTMEYLRRLLSDYAALGANSLLVEYVDRFPFARHPDIVHRERLSTGELSELVSTAKELGLEIIPLIQALAHVEPVLRHEGYRELGENPSSPSPWQYCPRKEPVFSFLMDCFEELCAAHPEGAFLHLGCDESWELATCPECRGEDPAAIFADWVNRLSRELKRRWGRRTMIWGDMLMPFTCESPTYPGIAGLLDHDAVICYWNYWGTRVFPHLEYFRDRGLTVVAASSSHASSQCFTDANVAVPNVVGFARQSSLFDNVIGDAITSWAGPPLGAEPFIQGMGLRAMVDPWTDPTIAERQVAERLFGSPDRELIEAVYLLGKTPEANDAPWRKLACQKAKETLARYDLDNPYLAVLDLQADFWFPEVLGRLIRPESAREMLATVWGL